MPTASLGATGQSDPNASAVEGYYTKYLGRNANPGDAQTWLSGGYGYGTDLPTIENAIKSSPEALVYRTATNLWLNCNRIATKLDCRNNMN